MKKATSCVTPVASEGLLGWCRYQKQLCEYLEANKAFVAPDKRLNEVLGWINSEVPLLSQHLAALPR